MEGVGARLGRSSTRYGPTTVFNGPVRKWKKRWVHVSPSSNNNHKNHSQNHHINPNDTTNGNNGSHVLLYRWTPITHSNNKDNSNTNGNNANASKNSVMEDDTAAPEEPPRRRFKYIPVDMIVKQKNEAAENVDEVKQSDTDPIVVEPVPKSDGLDAKPDINDVPMEENQSQDENQVIRQDLNESTLDLSLGLKSHDGDSCSKPDQSRDGQLERVNSE